MVGCAGQRPIDRLFPFAAGSMGALARCPLGGGRELDGAIGQPGYYAWALFERLGTVQLKRNRVGGRRWQRGGNVEVADIYSHDCHPWHGGKSSYSNRTSI